MMAWYWMVGKRRMLSRYHRFGWCLRLLGAGVCALGLTAAPAYGEGQSPQWSVTSTARPTHFAPAANEVQAITVSASGGTFTLTLKGQTTGGLPGDATAAEVQAALDALSTVGGVGASVGVTGGPGGVAPYMVTFGGSLHGRNVEEIQLETDSLDFHSGDTMRCEGAPVSYEEGKNTFFTYQWLRDGEPIAGATTATYTTGVADEGAVVQCVIDAAQDEGLPANTGVSPARVVAPEPATPAPHLEGVIEEPKGNLEAGEELFCENGNWEGSPTFTYQWLRNGRPIPGATEFSYVLKAADFPAHMQCEVFATNAGGTVAGVSEWKGMSNANSFAPNPTATIPAGAVATTTEGGSEARYTIEVKNTGGTASSGSAIALTDVLPSGLSLSGEVSGKDFLTGRKLTCNGLTCEYVGVLPPDDSLVVSVPVAIEPGAPESVTNVVTVAGGGASAAFVETPTPIVNTPAGFGFSPGSVYTTLSNTQAGGHPDLTTSFSLNSLPNGLLAGDPKETVADLPPGFVGDLADTPTCPIANFARLGQLFEDQPCALSTQIGTTTLDANLGSQLFEVVVPVYNLSPNPGEIARLGFQAVEWGVQGTISLRPGDYGVRATFEGINEHRGELEHASLTVWGVPTEASHDAMRGLVCNGIGTCEYLNREGLSPVELGVPLGNPKGTQISGETSSAASVPYLTSPTDCTGAPLAAVLTASSWENPTQPVNTVSMIGPMIGCNLLEFGPVITAAPDTTRADTPAGFTFEVKMLQQGLVTPGVLPSADIENTTATLPQGVVINPGQAAGLGACQVVQAALESDGPQSCPSSAKVGIVQVETPVLRNKLEGNVYVLQSNPPNLKILVAPEDRQDGIYVKFVGNVHLDAATGQIISTFEKTPQLPFTDLKLSFSGGAQAALATPTACGRYAANADFTPWSGEAHSRPSSSPFVIDSGPTGGPCATPLPFAPSLTAGSTTDQAGGFTNFSMLLTREDDQQRISRLQFKTPPGLLGMISKVQVCTEAQAVHDECPAGSQIGHTVVEAGPGPYPLVVPQPGAPSAPIYLTGPYEGAPYGLLIKVPLVVGPFVLETQRVRARIEVDPLTTQLTITTDPIPTIVDGVPSDLKAINAVIDRSEFMFNPTNCSRYAFAGTVSSNEAATAAISSPFQVGSCRSLKFEPSLQASVGAKATRKSGVSFKVKLTYPKTTPGTEANIQSVKVDLPRFLPSRLSTLQQACTAAVFSRNPASCPSGSRVGQARAVTPVLATPLEGPAYFVSHGGQKFPELVIVLQGAGITAELHGETFISKSNITSSTFRQVPDVPVGTFELTLPQGPNSALAATTNLCTHKLKMPTAFVGQNGLTIKGQTAIGVSGCPKAKKGQHKRV